MRKSEFSLTPHYFSQLAAIEEREENIEKYFDFELTHRPESLLENQLMRKPDKAPIRYSQESNNSSRKN